jgi:hypothetical protein
MSETLSQKIGRKTLQGIANRQNGALAPSVLIDGDGFRSTQLRRRNARNGHDYLHIFFHPDYDRRLWHRTRSADPARKLPARTGARGLVSGLSPRHIPPVGNYTPP